MKELYSFCAHFFQNRGVEHAAKKWDEVKVQMETAVDLLDSLQGKKIHEFQLLPGLSTNSF